MFYHTDHSWMISLQSDCADDLWEFFSVWNFFHTECIYKAFLLCEFSCDYLDVLYVWNSFHTQNRWKIFWLQILHLVFVWNSLQSLKRLHFRLHFWSDEVFVTDVCLHFKSVFLLHLWNDGVCLHSLPSGLKPA